MARIRAIKPEFFRHEGLQDLEAANPGAHVMLVFAGLWGNCDKAGIFEWKPRTLKLDILPFLEFNMEKTLALLEEAGLIARYEVDGKQYGEVVTFEKHQRISGKEAQEPVKHPARTSETIGKHRGSTGEAPGKQQRRQEGKGREEEGKGVEQSAPASPTADFPAAESKPRTTAITFDRFIADCKTSGVKPLPDGDPVFEWAGKAGIDIEFLRLAWIEFKSRYSGQTKRYRDWRKVFGNAVRDNWFRLWWCNESGQCELTNQGRLIANTHREAA